MGSVSFNNFNPCQKVTVRIILREISSPWHVFNFLNSNPFNKINLDNCCVYDNRVTGGICRVNSPPRNAKDSTFKKRINILLSTLLEILMKRTDAIFDYVVGPKVLDIGYVGQFLRRGSTNWLHDKLINRNFDVWGIDISREDVERDIKEGYRNLFVMNAEDFRRPPRGTPGLLGGPRRRSRDGAGDHRCIGGGPHARARSPRSLFVRRRLRPFPRSPAGLRVGKPGYGLSHPFPRMSLSTDWTQ